METGTSGQHETRTRTRNKYEREQLFKLAKLVPFERSFIEELERFESGDWPTEEQTEQTEQTEHFPKSISKLGRQHSELASTSASTKDCSSQRNLENCRQGRESNSRLARMTSSPSIKYNNGNNLNQPKGDLISSQVWAKYERLLQVSGERKTNRWQELRDPPERPTRLFGPLRRERKQSDEPLSLPYISYDSRGPIKRISSGFYTRQDKSQNENEPSEDSVANQNGKEDEFDISSLLSITVLSDIKAIRHNEPVSSRKLNLVNNSSRSSEMGIMRGITRARTSTDFTRDGRQAFNHKQQRQYENNNRFFPDQFSSLVDSKSGRVGQFGSSSSFSQQNSFYDCREVAPSSPPKRELHKMPDESTAKIIETFKAQVRARAAQQVETKQTSSTPTSTSTTTTTTTINEIDRNRAEKKSELASSAQTKERQKSAQVESVSREGESKSLLEVNVESELSKSKRSSNIPRLISLYETKTKPKTKSSLGQEKVEESKSVEGEKKKIISQYKLLRGKSLADEFEETSNSKK